MPKKIDWKRLAIKVGSINPRRRHIEHGGDYYAALALELFLDPVIIDSATDAALQLEPGSELALSVLKMVRPWRAMKRCYAIYKKHDDIQDALRALYLIYQMADARSLTWVEEFLAHENANVAKLGADIVSEALWHDQLASESKLLKKILPLMKSHKNLVVVKEYKRIIKEHGDLANIKAACGS